MPNPSGEQRARAATLPRARAAVRHEPPEPLDPTQHGCAAIGLSDGLHRMIIGQDEAIRVIVSAYQMFLAGLNAPSRPLGNFLLLGPTGSGKTRIVEATAETLLHNPRAVIKIDCAEFQHSHEISKLIGSPPGYLGHRETHPLLSQEVLSQYHSETCKISFVLFDEIEKASDALWNLLLGILDKGTLTLGDNRRVDFSRALIFMTSNLGAKEMDSAINAPMGFARPADSIDRAAPVIERAGKAAARKKFTPEFMNRLDSVVVFRKLGSPELRQILEIELGMVQQRVFNASPEHAFAFKVSDEAKELILTEGTDVKYGARHLKRAIERLLVQPIANLVASGQVAGGDCIFVDRAAGHRALHFSREASNVFSTRIPPNATTAASGRRA